ncbi:MAG: DUF4923 family protein [Parabacteroides sp.]|nr:DUF4923 family protein [Parabacteroides sp.]
MRKLVVLLLAVSFVFTVKAQSLKDILNSQTVKDVVTSVTGGKQLSNEALKGNWLYISPAVQLNGDNAIKNIAGTVATSELEKKLSEYCNKVGIVEGVFNYTFNSDKTFVCQLKSSKLNGSYTINTDGKSIDMSYTIASKKIITLTANVIITNNNLILLFNADKLLDFIEKISSISSNQSLQTISKLASQYDGVMLGFELQKQN